MRSMMTEKTVFFSLGKNALTNQLIKILGWLTIICTLMLCYIFFFIFFFAALATFIYSLWLMRVLTTIRSENIHFLSFCYRLCVIDERMTSENVQK